MEDKLVTLAIHTYQKAQVIKTLLESNGIDVYLHNVNLIQPVVSSGVRVRIKESDLLAALKIIENTNLLDDAQAELKLETEKKKAVLIPVDFSDYSKHACEIGFNYAKNIDAEVIILHAYYAPFFPSTISFGEPFYQVQDNETLLVVTQKAQQDLDDFAKFIEKNIAAKKWPEVPFSCLLREGLPEDEINSYCKENKPVMVFMGTRGKNQKDVDLIGSVTAEVIDRVKTPILAIPENTPFRNLSQVKRIAFGTNFDQKDLVTVDSLFHMFKNDIIEYYLFHVTSKQDTWNEIKLSGIKDYFEKQYPKVTIKYEIVDANDFVLNLEQFVRDHRIDIISLTAYKRNIFARMFNPGMARKMLFHSDTPLLVLHS
ncbi:MAG: universal stress protein [Candidatus Azobacteroides sp.]|nr:universal stress protein [Candidatus Azobacteroides sp.]